MKRHLLQQWTEEQSQLKWTLFAPNANGVVSNNGLTFAKVSDGDWTCATRGSVGWSSGVHQWTVRMDKLPKGVSVGISRCEIDFADACNNINKRYDVYGGTGHAIDIENDEFACLKRPFEVGDLVTIKLDLNFKTLTFGLNGKMNLKPTFRDLGDGDWFPYFAFCSKGSTVTVDNTTEDAVTIHLNHFMFAKEPWKLFRAVVLCRLPSGWDCNNKNRNAYVVRETLRDECWIVTREMIVDKVFYFDPQNIDSPQVGRRIVFTVEDAVCDTSGTMMLGKKLGGTFLEQLPNDWVFFRVDRPHYDERDPDNWWTGFGVRKRNTIYFSSF